MAARPARTSDIDAVTETVTLAFASDPIWGPALRGANGGSDHLRSYWRLFVTGAVRYGTVHMIDDGAAVSVWIPPDGTELDDDGLAAFERIVEAALTPDTLAALHVLYARFEASRAGRDPHYYLSLLATHPDHRGRGIGQALLAEDLASWDAAGFPAYLESTNPANDHRYLRAGFRSDGGFPAVLDDAWVTAMWRPVGGA